MCLNANGIKLTMKETLNLLALPFVFIYCMFAFTFKDPKHENIIK